MSESEEIPIPMEVIVNFQEIIDADMDLRVAQMRLHELTMCPCGPLAPLAENLKETKMELTPMETFNDMGIDQNSNDVVCLKCHKVVIPYSSEKRDWGIWSSPTQTIVDHRSNCLGIKP